jgi:hypothetical protein
VREGRVSMSGRWVDLGEWCGVRLSAIREKGYRSENTQSESN